MSLCEVTTALGRTRRYIGELVRAGELRVSGHGNKRLFVAAEVERLKDVLYNSVDLFSVLREYGIAEEYEKFAEDNFVSQCVRKVGVDYFVRNENVDILLRRLRTLDQQDEKQR